jgi:hypothetical protein
LPAFHAKYAALGRKSTVSKGLVLSDFIDSGGKKLDAGLK